ncbi:SURF1 family cytochrome oxidase biogenesis protein [Streptomyces tubercidicus]|uniref:SURF1-like protein n=1 Tax=Streptomyces tubercidicus TaxID=47759 RepID=A0A640UZH3_9ACTN|nr:SURF1 family protein [Streptomyces tubercidicus]WAU14895.1 SURF1 family protein [Streptomyces tubercidicus]GFE40692.1 SURF1-like protein [Streptomyces tubercidicus]
MYRFLLTRQWVILTLLGLVLIPVMIKLGYWQFHRHEHKVAQNQLIARSIAATPVPVTTLAAPGRDLPRRDMWHRVTATGTYDTAHEVVVRQRTAADEQSIGYYVLTPLVLGNGQAVLINRGWISAGNDLTKFPDVPAAPRGKVTVTGRMMADETTAESGIKDTKGLPARQVMLINSAEQAKRVGRPVLGGYIEQSAPEPPGNTPELVPAPDHDSIGPHMAYAIQWWLFAAAVPVGWIVLVRRERRDRATAAAEEAEKAEKAEAARETEAAGAARDGGRTAEPAGSGETEAAGDDATPAPANP